MYCISLYTLNGEVTEDIISQAYENLLDENTTLFGSSAIIVE